MEYRMHVHYQLQRMIVPLSASTDDCAIRLVRDYIKAKRPDGFVYISFHNAEPGTYRGWPFSGGWLNPSGPDYTPEDWLQHWSQQ